MSAAHAELERRYRWLLRLYPREFRARREAEMLGVLMAGARDGQNRPARGDVSDIVKGSLLMRLRGPRGGWAPALAMFALLAPLYLVVTDILQVAFPYGETTLQAALPARNMLPHPVVEHIHDGGIQLLSQPSFLTLAAGHVVVAVAVLAGSRRTALAALLAAGSVDSVCWNSFNTIQPGTGTLVLVTVGVFLLEAVALGTADPRAACRLVRWWHAATVAILAGGMQAWSVAFDAGLNSPTGSLDHTALVTGFVLAAIALVLPVILGLGWHVSLLFAAMFYPGAAGLAIITMVPDGEDAPVVFALSSRPTLLLALYVPPLLVACWGAARSLRAPRTRYGGVPGPGTAA
ncbi:MAG TPA: hypothetical protein VH589_20775 [Trebonia sp.]